MRPIWSGAISFGLIYIPVNLYSASRENRPSFQYLRKSDLCPIKYARICRRTGEEVSFPEIGKGYEYEKGDYIMLEDDDFKKANVEKYRTINIFKFVDPKEIDEKYFEKPYYLEPTKQSETAYILLREALKRSGKAGIGKFMLSSREHMALIKPEKEVIILEQMRASQDIRSTEGLKITKKKPGLKQELDMAIRLIEQLTSHFSPDDFRDAYSKNLQQVISAKKKGKLEKHASEEKEFTEVPDIMQQLKRSLEKVKVRN